MSKQNDKLVRKSNGTIGRVIYIAVVVVLALLAGFFFYKYQDVNQKYTEATQSTEDKIRIVVADVSKLYDIPSFDTEKPIVPGLQELSMLTITEEELPQLKESNSFFDSAQAGDILLAYKDANLAILYRPSENKIVKVGKYADAAIFKVKISIASSEAITKALGDRIKAKFPNVNVESFESKLQETLGRGVVIDVSGKEESAAKQVAELLGFEVGSLPAGVTAPENTVLVIIPPQQNAQ